MDQNEFTDWVEAESRIDCESDRDAQEFMEGAIFAKEILERQVPSDEEVTAIMDAITTPLGEEVVKGEWARAAVDAVYDDIREEAFDQASTDELPYD